MKYLIFSLLCSWGLCSCQTKQEGRELLHEESKSRLVSELVSDYIIIPLETTDDNLILDPTVVQFSSKYLFILDRFSPSKSLYVFDHQGNYIGKVGRKGEGPGEYILPHQFVVNEGSGKLYLRDMATNSLMVYALDDFHFIEKLPVPFHATCFEQLDDAHFIWYVNAGLQNQGEYRKHLQVTDLDCRPVSSWIDMMEMPQRGIYNVMSYFTMQDRGLRFHHPFSGDYYSCSLEHPNLLQFAYSLKFEDLSFPSLDYVQANRDNIVKELEADRYIQWCDVWGNSSVLLSYFGIGKAIYWGRYDVKSDSGWYVDKDRLEDDLGIGRLSRPKTVYRDYFVSFLSMEGDRWETLSENSILKKQLEKECVGENPIVLLYR